MKSTGGGSTGGGGGSSSGGGGGWSSSYNTVNVKVTDKDGIIILPAVEHKAYIVGYEDGTFRPDSDMTRAEAAAIFARLISEEKGDANITRAEVVTVVNRATDRVPDKEYINDNLSTLDKFTDLKNNAHWAYYDIMEAANTHMAVRNSNTETWVK